MGPIEMGGIVVSAQDVMTKVLAYIAGAQVLGTDFDTRALTKSAARHWSDYVSPGWAARTAFYSSLPDARDEMGGRQWMRTLRAGIVIERRFLADMGFSWGMNGDGNQYFIRTGPDPLFHDRVQRALVDFPE